MLFLIFLVYIPLICGLISIFILLNIWWERNKRQHPKSSKPLHKIVNYSCCCVSSDITNILTKINYISTLAEEHDGRSSSHEKLNETLNERRPTICRIDLDVQTPKPEPNTWGIANDTLFTDFITVTPKSTPDMHRKVQLPMGSPLLHHKSQNQLNRPAYQQSFSNDSGCVSDFDYHKDKQAANMSMTSLVNAFTKFGRKNASREGITEPEIRNSHMVSGQKSMPLSRLVIDPYGPKRHSKPECDSPKPGNPAFNRSISSDAATHHRVFLDIPSNKTILKDRSNISISTKSSSDDDTFKENKNNIANESSKLGIPNISRSFVSGAAKRTDHSVPEATSASKVPILPSNSGKPKFPLLPPKRLNLSGSQKQPVFPQVREYKNEERTTSSQGETLKPLLSSPNDKTPSPTLPQANNESHVTQMQNHLRNRNESPILPSIKNNKVALKPPNSKTEIGPLKPHLNVSNKIEPEKLGRNQKYFPNATIPVDSADVEFINRAANKKPIFPPDKYK